MAQFSLLSVHIQSTVHPTNGKALDKQQVYNFLGVSRRAMFILKLYIAYIVDGER